MITFKNKGEKKAKACTLKNEHHLLYVSLYNSFRNANATLLEISVHRSEFKVQESVLSSSFV